MKTYGMVGISVYRGLTAVSIGLFYATLRSGVSNVETMVTIPISIVLRENSELVQSIQRQWQDNNSQQPADNGKSGWTPRQQISWTPEVTYLGIANVAGFHSAPYQASCSCSVGKKDCDSGKGWMSLIVMSINENKV